MTGPLLTVPDQARAGAEDIVRGAITVVSLAFGVGLLAAGMALPLHWLPGQIAVLSLLLALLPGTVVLTAGRLAGMVGIAAADFARRARVTRWTVVGLLAVALPLYQAHVLGHGANAGDPPFTIAGAVALCWIVSEIAASLARSWATLQVQPWEVNDAEAGEASAVSLETAGRVNRGRILGELWRQWVAGEVTLAVVLLARAQLSQGHEAAAMVGLLAFVIYTLAGLVLLSQAARARQTVNWHLSGLTIPPGLEHTWNGAGLRVAVVVMLGIGLLLVLHALDLAHAAVQWTAVAILQPLLGPLARWLQQVGNHALNNCGGDSGCGSPPGSRSVPSPPRAILPQKGHVRGIDLSWLQHLWPAALVVLLAALVARAYWETRGNGLGRGIWREMLAILFRDLRLLGSLFWRPARRLFLQVTEGISGSNARRSRPSRRRHKHSWESPRQAVIALYLAALAFAARRGHPRRPSQTPREYAAELAERLPAGAGALSEMTDLFVAIRYSQESAGPETVGRMRALGEMLRALLS